MQEWDYIILSVYEGKEKRWAVEYKGWKHVENKDPIQVMKGLGENGWELVSSLPFEVKQAPIVPPQTYTTSYLLFFKKPKEK